MTYYHIAKNEGQHNLSYGLLFSDTNFDLLDRADWSNKTRYVMLMEFHKANQRCAYIGHTMPYSYKRPVIDFTFDEAWSGNNSPRQSFTIYPFGAPHADHYRYEILTLFADNTFQIEIRATVGSKDSIEAWAITSRVKSPNRIYTDKRRPSLIPHHDHTSLNSWENAMQLIAKELSLGTQII